MVWQFYKALKRAIPGKTAKEISELLSANADTSKELFSSLEYRNYSTNLVKLVLERGRFSTMLVLMKNGCPFDDLQVGSFATNNIYSLQILYEYGCRVDLLDAALHSSTMSWVWLTTRPEFKKFLDMVRAVQPKLARIEGMDLTPLPENDPEHRRTVRAVNEQMRSLSLLIAERRAELEKLPPNHEDQYVLEQDIEHLLSIWRQVKDAAIIRTSRPKDIATLDLEEESRIAEIHMVATYATWEARNNVAFHQTDIRYARIVAQEARNAIASK